MFWEQVGKKRHMHVDTTSLAQGLTPIPKAKKVNPQLSKEGSQKTHGLFHTGLAKFGESFGSKN